MCLTIPKKVVSIEGDSVFVENLAGDRQGVKTIVKLNVGDYVITQQNVVVQRINKAEADEIFKIIAK